MASPIDFSFLNGPTNPISQGDFNDAAGPTSPIGAEPSAGVKAGLQKFLSDPNMLRFLSEMGSNVSQGQGVGQAVGDATGANLRRTAFQEAGAKTSGGQSDIMQQVIAALQGKGDISKLVTAKGDPSGADSISITPEGANVKVPFAKAPAAPAFESDKPLESITGNPLGNAAPTAPVSDARTRDPEQIGSFGSPDPFPFL